MKFFSRKKDERPPWERSNGKREMEIWVKRFLAKLNRTSTRTQKCRLILSVERMQFEVDWYAGSWEYVRFEDEEAEIFRKNKDSLQKIKLTVQKVMNVFRYLFKKEASKIDMLKMRYRYPPLIFDICLHKLRLKRF